MVVRIFIMLIVFGGLNFYIGWHGALFFSFFSEKYLPIYWIVFWVIAFSFIISQIPTKGFLRAPKTFLKIIGSYYFAVMNYAVILLLLVDVGYFILKGLQVDLSDIVNMGAEGVKDTYKDTYFVVIDYVPLIGFLVLFFLSCLLLFGSRNAWKTVIRKYQVKVNKHSEIKKLKIAMVTDIHLGDLIGNRHLKRLQRIMDEMQPDLILFSGDVIDNSVEPFMRKKMYLQLAKLKVKYGIFAVLGNHEYYGGHIEEYVGKMKEIGIPVLQDETVLVGESFYIAGRKDKAARSFDPVGRITTEELLTDLDKTRPIILMDHQPYEFEKAASAGADFLLCGHTHRGQLAPFHLVTKRLYELDWGYMKKQEMHVFVSSGFGSWGPPIRMASRSEVLEIHVEFMG